MDLPNDILNIIFNLLPKTFQYMLSLTCKKHRLFKMININSFDIAKDGELKFLKQCKNINTKTWKAAIKNGHIHILEWLDINFSIKKKNSSFCSYAAKNNQLKSLKWLVSSNFHMDLGTCIQTVNNENIEILEYIYPFFAPRYHVCSIAAVNGRISVLEFFYKNNYPIHKSCMEWAIMNGCLDIIKFLTTIGFDIDINIYHLAVENRRENIIQWFKDNGYPHY